MTRAPANAVVVMLLLAVAGLITLGAQALQWRQAEREIAATDDCTIIARAAYLSGAASLAAADNVRRTVLVGRQARCIPVVRRLTALPPRGNVTVRTGTRLQRRTWLTQRRICGPWPCWATAAQERRRSPKRCC